MFTSTRGDDPIWRAYFSNGLVQPRTSIAIKVYVAFGNPWHFCEPILAMGSMAIWVSIAIARSISETFAF